MNYHWIASTIEIKTAVLPSREINNYVIFADFKSFQAIFIDFLGHFIDNFYNILGHQNPGPDHYNILTKSSM